MTTGVRVCAWSMALWITTSGAAEGMTPTRTSTPTRTHPPTPIVTPLKWAVERGRVWTIVEGATVSGETGCAVGMVHGHKTVQVEVQAGTFSGDLVCHVSVHSPGPGLVIRSFTGSDMFEFDTNCELLCFENVVCSGCRWSAWISGD